MLVCLEGDTGQKSAMDFLFLGECHVLCTYTPVCLCGVSRLLVQSTLSDNI